MEDPKFLDPCADIVRRRRRLPHWEQDGATYFVTCRLADSIPVERLSEWREERTAWLRLHPEPRNAEREAEYHRLFSGSIERWLDQGEGSCALAEPGAAEALAGVMSKFEGIRFSVHSRVVMPNHLHVLFSMRENESLSRTLKAWKGVSARHINQIRGVTGCLWQEESFDRLIRDGRHFWNCARYIRNNPRKAGLRRGFLLYESDPVREALDAE